MLIGTIANLNRYLLFNLFYNVGNFWAVNEMMLTTNQKLDYSVAYTVFWVRWCFEHDDSFGICDGIIDFYMKLLHICIWAYLCMNMPLPAWSSHKCLDVEVNGAVFLWEQRHLHSTAQLVAGRMATQYRRAIVSCKICMFHAIWQFAHSQNLKIA